ncbi:alpha/beta hydrolase [Pseudovibrio brasiliensis]|uniref:Alpha/beta hydrolase n=1 Tax=Pseudovibrio brasiliensis TaxID=1898042 RepID=A0ABX8AWW0_9HYPH|nr:alpha/beta hydrolase [Pseudovibrio brasiliensis]QUS58727.1 alpha/beta hydrolase [Pseudovibrio brasiliensis]
MSNSSLPPVLLLTGTNAAAWAMENVRTSLEAAGYVCHSLTYRYHDLPPGPERDAKLTGLSIADYVEDARQAIDEIGEPPVVVGHSIGGLIAQLLAAEDAIKAGVLLNSSIVNGTLPTTEEERDLGKLLISAGAFWERALEQDFELLAKYGFNTLSPQMQRDIHGRLGSESGRVLFEFFFWMYDVHRTTFVDPDKVTCPLLFISGNEDKAVPPSTARVMAERYETAEFLAVGGACHYIQFDEQWPETAAKMLDWLSRNL